MLKKIKELILNKENNKFLIFMHQNPDGDALGSALAMKVLLEKLEKDVLVVSVDSIPHKYDFLPGIKDILKIDKDTVLIADVAVFIESANIARVGCEKKFLQVGKIINIDHHKINDEYGDINWLDSKKAAVAVMVYEIFKYLDVSINKAAAECLYTGIVTDTGRFQYSNMSIDIYKIIGKLVKKGLDVNYIYRQIYGRKSKSHINFMRLLLANLEFHRESKIAISFITDLDISENKIINDDIDGAADFLRDIEGVELACFIKPKDEGLYKLSLRSKEYVSVCDISQKFGGGGHKYAAGFELKAESMIDLKNNILQIFSEEELWG
ncbi:MAG: bifunctional oligoribonuclease/PAP phosphatase NrnA [bacterium]|nr:bifunctional oligoribonuclease/PAP phosphatase NrnA [bacterium]